MTLAIKTEDQNSSFDFDDIEKMSGHVSKEPVIAFRDVCFYVSVSAADKLQLKQFRRVRFSVLKGESYEETEKLYIDQITIVLVIILTIISCSRVRETLVE